METLCHNFGAQNQCQIETVCFSSGEQFLEAFEQDKFSIVFMDIYMKGINGITTALSMREKDNCCLLVFLTSSMEFMPDAFSCHAFEYITKPFSPDRAYAILHDALQVLPPPPKYIEIISDRKTFSLPARYCIRCDRRSLPGDWDDRRFRPAHPHDYAKIFTTDRQ